MFELRDIIFEEFEKTRLKVIDNMRTNDQIVSGKTAASLRTEAENNEGVLWGAEHIDTLETGISPFQSRQNPFKDTYYALNRWYQMRGLTTGFYKDNRIFKATVNQREIGSLLFRSTKGTPTGNVFRKEINPLVKNIGDRIGDKIINTKILP